MDFVITVSRQYGSGGRIFAERLAAALGIPLYDKSLLDKASQSSGIAKEHFENVDERHRSSFLFSLVTSHYVSGVSPVEVNNIINEDNLFLHTSETIRKIGQSPCVILGRCADEILKDRKILRIFVSANMSDRIERVKSRFDGMTDKAVATLIRKTDKNRSNYYNYYTGNHWGEAANYDVCINTSKIDIDKAVIMICGLVNA